MLAAKLTQIRKALSSGSSPPTLKKLHFTKSGSFVGDPHPPAAYRPDNQKSEGGESTFVPVDKATPE